MSPCSETLPIRSCFFTLDCEDVSTEDEWTHASWLVELLRSHGVAPLVFLTGGVVRYYPDAFFSTVCKECAVGYHTNCHDPKASLGKLCDQPESEAARQVAAQLETHSCYRGATTVRQEPGGVLSFIKRVPDGHCRALRSPGFAWHPAHYEVLAQYGFDTSFDLYPHLMEGLPRVFVCSGFRWFRPDQLVWLDRKNWEEVASELTRPQGPVLYNFAFHPFWLYRTVSWCVDLSPATSHVTGERTEIAALVHERRSRARELLPRILQWCNRQQVEIVSGRWLIEECDGPEFTPSEKQVLQICQNSAHWTANRVGHRPRYLLRSMIEFFRNGKA